MAARGSPVQIILSGLAKVLCLPLPLRLALSHPRSPAEERDEGPPFDRAIGLLQALVQEPGLLPEAATVRVLDALELLETARTSFAHKAEHEAKEVDAGHAAVTELSRHLDEGGGALDDDTHAWLLDTTVPAGLSVRQGGLDESFGKKLKDSARRFSDERMGSRRLSGEMSPPPSRRSGKGPAGPAGPGMKRIMTAPVSLTELAAPRSIPKQSKGSRGHRVLACANGASGAQISAFPEDGEGAEEVDGSVRSAPPQRNGNGTEAIMEEQEEESALMVTETPSTHELVASPFFTATPSQWKFAAAIAPSLRLCSFDWEYDVVDLDVASSSHCLTSLFHEILRRYDLVHRLREESGLHIDVVKLATFLQHVEATYGDNPYRASLSQGPSTLSPPRMRIRPATNPP